MKKITKKNTKNNYKHFKMSNETQQKTLIITKSYKNQIYNKLFFQWEHLQNCFVVGQTPVDKSQSS